MTAYIAARHPKRDERPLLLVVSKPGAQLARDELPAFYAGRIAKWWTPDDMVFVDAIALGATGKMLKHRLRERCRRHRGRGRAVLRAYGLPARAGPPGAAP